MLILTFFCGTLGAMSDEHGKRFHQDIALIKSQYKGKSNASMMSEYCWSLQSENNLSYIRSAKRPKLIWILKKCDLQLRLRSVVY